MSTESPANPAAPAATPAVDPQAPPTQPRQAVAPDSGERLAAMVAHGAGVLTWVIAPLTLYLVQNDRRSLVAWHAREAFNFQLSKVVYYLLALSLCFVYFIDLDGLPFAIALAVLFVPPVLLVALLVFELVLVSWASVAACQGKFCRCPLNIPFIPRPKEFSNTDAYVDRE
jgi:uncharacterized Tic20 family protein